MTRQKRKVGTSSGGNVCAKTCSDKRKRRGIPNISVLENYVKQFIVGQDEAIKKIVTAIYKAMEFKTIKTNLLILGGSGTGKTEIVTQIAKRLGLAYTIEDATKYTKEGYYGADVDEMISNLLENADNDLEKAQNGLLIIDEIDKKATSSDFGPDISGSDVLKSMLRIIQGTKIKIPDPNDIYKEDTIEFDTSNLIVIFMGAFSGLDKIRDKRNGKGTVGFSKKADSSNDSSKRFTKDDLNIFGMPEEFIGRVDTIVETRNLTVQDLREILKRSKLSVFRKYQNELRNRGIALSYDGELLTKIAETSLNLGTGARELSNTVNYVFENIIYDVFNAPSRYYSKCELSLDIVTDNTKYKLS